MTLREEIARELLRWGWNNDFVWDDETPAQKRYWLTEADRIIRMMRKKEEQHGKTK